MWVQSKINILLNRRKINGLIRNEYEIGADINIFDHNGIKIIFVYFLIYVLYVKNNIRKLFYYTLYIF